MGCGAAKLSIVAPVPEAVSCDERYADSQTGPVDSLYSTSSSLPDHKEAGGKSLQLSSAEDQGVAIGDDDDR